MKDFIFPRALRLAAVAFAGRPKIVGEILVALVAEDGSDAAKSLSEVQQYILGECRAEIAERLDRRAKESERKRKQRTGGNR